MEMSTSAMNATAVSRVGEAAIKPSGASGCMRAIQHLIQQVAPTDSNVLVLGESGTGKELIARHIHESSTRASKPFVPINCGAIPPELLESELFGHEKGAFTGALSARMGRFEFAEGGTLFLDEIGDMSLNMQVKLLRVLQERSFERVGSNRTIRCNVRIIAATHRNLEAAIDEGRFREDLFYRLNVFPIQIPPLRDRLDDIPVLIEHLLERQQRGGGRKIRFAADAMACLKSCRWPGNVRELGNLIERMSILFPDQTIRAADLPDRYRGSSSPHAGFLAEPMLRSIAEEQLQPAMPVQPVAPVRQGAMDLNGHMSAIELGLIRKAMADADGTVSEAARMLGLRRTTLVERLRKYRLQA